VAAMNVWLRQFCHHNPDDDNDDGDKLTHFTLYKLQLIYYIHRYTVVYTWLHVCKM
jgi:hypothetical protein